MLGLILLSLLGTAAVAAATGLFDGSGDQTAEDAVDDADLEDEVALLDESEVEEMEAALADDPTIAQGEVASEDDLLQPYEDLNGFADIDGTEGRDLIAIPEEVGSDHDLIRAAGEDDVIVGNSAGNAMTGGEGDDLLSGIGGFDQMFGDEGDDTLIGGDGGDLLVGDFGSDVVYGGAGDDAIHDGTQDGTDRDSTDVLVGGAGDDGIIVQDGVNLVSLGGGEDHVTVHADTGDDPGAVITDFDVTQDALLLGIHAPGVTLPAGANGIELGFTLREIETDLGPGTLVQPAGTDDLTADDLGDGASVGYAVLLGLRPEDLAGADIRVVLQTPDTDPFAAGSIEAVAAEMGATRI
jgi:Ca2+-binding RTX toxin-like protein